MMNGPNIQALMRGRNSMTLQCNTVDLCQPIHHPSPWLRESYVSSKGQKDSMVCSYRPDDLTGRDTIYMTHLSWFVCRLEINCYRFPFTYRKTGENEQQWPSSHLYALLNFDEAHEAKNKEGLLSNILLFWLVASHQSPETSDMRSR